MKSLVAMFAALAVMSSAFAQPNMTPPDQLDYAPGVQQWWDEEADLITNDPSPARGQFVFAYDTCKLWIGEGNIPLSQLEPIFVSETGTCFKPKQDTTPPAISITQDAIVSDVATPINITVSVVDNVGITAANVEVLTTGIIPKSWLCSQVSTTQIQCTGVIDVPGEVYLAAVDNEGNRAENISKRYAFLAHHWPLDEGSGTTAADIIGGSNGNVRGTATWVAGAVGSNAIASNTAGDMIEVPFSPTFNRTPMTWSIIAKLDSPGPSRQQTLMETNVTGVPYQGFSIGVFGTNAFACSVGGTEFSVSSLEPATFDEWHLVDCVLTASGTLEIWVDGVKKNQAEAVALLDTASTTWRPFSLAEFSSATQFLIGSIDEAKIYWGEIDQETRQAALEAINPGAAETVQHPADPAGCVSETNSGNYNARGLVNVIAHGATPNDPSDDDAPAIQAAFAAADAQRGVYFPHGDYHIESPIQLKQEVYVHPGSSNYRAGHVGIGSVCKNERPRIIMKDGLFNSASPDPKHPRAVFEIWRLLSVTTPIGSGDPSRDWNQGLMHLDIVTGANSGLACLLHEGAEGSFHWDITCDATGGFAGIVGWPSSGGGGVDIEVIGGRYAFWINDTTRPGGPPVVGLETSGQTDGVIAWRSTASPIFVGADITYGGTGPIFQTIVNDAPAGTMTRTFHPPSGHAMFVDSKIEVTGGCTVGTMFTNTERVLGLENVYIKGCTKVLDSTTNAGGDLNLSNATDWHHIQRFAFSGNYASPSMSIDGTLYNGGIYLNNTVTSPATLQTVSNTVSEAQIPSDLITQHVPPRYIVNPMGADVVLVTDYGADPDNANDNDQIGFQAAIDTGQRVYVPPSMAIGVAAGTYRTSDTITLGDNTVMFSYGMGVTVIQGQPNNNWDLTAGNVPMIALPSTAGASPTLAFLRATVPLVSGSCVRDNTIEPPGACGDGGYGNHVYALDWQSPKAKLIFFTYGNTDWGDIGNAQLNRITGNGGGKVWGITHNAGVKSLDFATDPRSPNARLMVVENTTNPLDLYIFHAQYLTPQGSPMIEFRNNTGMITIYGAKEELLTGGINDVNAFNATNTVRNKFVWAWFENSVARVFFVEGHAWVTGRGNIEVIDSDFYAVGIGNRYAPQSGAYFVKEYTRPGVTFGVNLTNEAFDGIDHTHHMGVFRTTP